MPLVKTLLLSLTVLFSMFSHAHSLECNTGRLKLPNDHWLFQENINTQKQILLYLARHNAYYCEKPYYSMDLISEVEKAAKTGNREPLDRVINSLIELIPDPKEKLKLSNQVGRDKLEKLIKKHTQSFDAIATAKDWGLIQSPDG